MYDIEKCVKLYLSIIDDYFSRSKYAGSDEVLSIDKIMTKKEEVGSEEEEEIANEDEKEHYIEALKYNEIMDLLNDAQFLQTMLNDGFGYPKLMKEFMVKNDGILHRLLNFSYELFVGKYVIDISTSNVLVIDEFVFGNMLSL